MGRALLSSILRPTFMLLALCGLVIPPLARSFPLGRINWRKNLTRPLEHRDMVLCWTVQIQSLPPAQGERSGQNGYKGGRSYHSPTGATTNGGRQHGAWQTLATQHALDIASELNLHLVHAFAQFPDHFLLCMQAGRNDHYPSFSKSASPATTTTTLPSTDSLLSPESSVFGQTTVPPVMNGAHVSHVNRTHSLLKQRDSVLFHESKEVIERKLLSHEEILWFSAEHVHLRHSRTQIPMSKNVQLRKNPDMLLDNKNIYEIKNAGNFDALLEEKQSASHNNEHSHKNGSSVSANIGLQIISPRVEKNSQAQKDKRSASDENVTASLYFKEKDVFAISNLLSDFQEQSNYLSRPEPGPVLNLDTKQVFLKVDASDVDITKDHMSLSSDKKQSLQISSSDMKTQMHPPSLYSAADPKTTLRKEVDNVLKRSRELVLSNISFYNDRDQAVGEETTTDFAQVQMHVHSTPSVLQPTKPSVIHPILSADSLSSSKRFLNDEDHALPKDQPFLSSATSSSSSLYILSSLSPSSSSSSSKSSSNSSRSRKNKSHVKKKSFVDLSETNLGHSIESSSDNEIISDKQFVKKKFKRLLQMHPGNSTGHELIEEFSHRQKKSVKKGLHSVNKGNFNGKQSHSKTNLQRERKKRSVSEVLTLNDPAFPKQWHLRNLVTPSMDINITDVWISGYRGQGVTVAVVDDGLEWQNPDIRSNYNRAGSWDLNGDDEDPTPSTAKATNHHGTRCAGEISAVANNSVCGVGVAFEGKISGIRVLDGILTDSMEAEAFNIYMDVNDIYSCSWGPDDDGRTVDGPHIMAAKAMKHGIDFGREGYGSIYVVASGNGGENQDNCNFDGYANSIYTVTIGAVDEDGGMPFYAEECASMLGVTFSSGTLNMRDIVTTDWMHGGSSVEGSKGCTDRHTGTSAAAPLAAGMIALMLQARPCLTWRDVQYIIILTGCKVDVDVAHWQKNGAGLFHSHKHGFGLMSAWRMVNAARIWDMVPWLTSYNYMESDLSLNIPKGSANPLVITHTVTKKMIQGLGLFILENVQLTVWLTHPYRGKLGVKLISPVGTVSVLATPRPKDNSSSGFDDWTFTTVRCWGEVPTGQWTIQFFDHDNGHYGFGTVTQWRLILFGTPMTPKEFAERRSLLEASMSGQYLATNLSRPCSPPPYKGEDYDPVSIRTLKILILGGGFLAVMALYESFEYIFCYDEEKKEHAKKTKLTLRAVRRMNSVLGQVGAVDTSQEQTSFPPGLTRETDQDETHRNYNSNNSNLADFSISDDDDDEEDLFKVSERSSLLKQQDRKTREGQSSHPTAREAIPLSTFSFQRTEPDTRTDLSAEAGLVSGKYDNINQSRYSKENGHNRHGTKPKYKPSGDQANSNQSNRANGFHDNQVNLPLNDSFSDTAPLLGTSSSASRLSDIPQAER